MRLHLPTVVALLFGVVLGACTVAGEAPLKRTGSSEDEVSEKKPSSKGTSSDADGADPTETVPSQPAPGSGGPVEQIGQKFPGSKAFLPRQLPAPGLLMLHGSEGGTDGTIEADAAFLAQQGFVVVTLCWFGCQGTPDIVLRVPLDRTVEAGTWLGSTEEVRGKKVGLFGWSRGAEQTVLIGSLLKTQTPFAALAVHAASDTVVAAYNPATDDSPMETKSGRSVPAPAWTFKGTPLFGEETASAFGTGPRIEIEKYPGPLFVSHGMKDQLWEVARGQRLVESRKRVPGAVTEAHFWPGVDHVIETQADQDKFDTAIIAFLSKELGR
jgi:dienelactone hydrolase